MIRGTVNICFLTLVFLSFLSGAHDFPGLGNGHVPRGLLVPECSSCACSEEDIDPFTGEGIEPFQPKPISLSFQILPEILVDQGVVRSIFRPPTFIL
jgi:hypothetical protein